MHLYYDWNIRINVNQNSSALGFERNNEFDIDFTVCFLFLNFFVLRISSFFVNKNDFQL